MILQWLSIKTTVSMEEKDSVTTVGHTRILQFCNQYIYDGNFCYKKYISLFLNRIYTQKYSQCAKNRERNCERERRVSHFYRQKTEVTDCMSFPIEFKNLSITFFQKSWHETWHAILIIICSGSTTKCDMYATTSEWSSDGSAPRSYWNSCWAQKNESMCWWVTTRSKIWHPTEWCSARNWNANEISISLIRWKQPIFLRYCTTCMSLLQQSLSHFLLLSSFQLEHDLSFHENHTFFFAQLFQN